MPAKSLLMLALFLAIPTSIDAQTDPLLQLLQHKHCARCNLNDADLVHADLRDVDLNEAQLKRANLSQAKLDGAAPFSSQAMRHRGFALSALLATPAAQAPAAQAGRSPANLPLSP